MPDLSRCHDLGGVYHDGDGDGDGRGGGPE